tara:strand:+ start:11394 stop:11921 length:528 start_codon:yes stop_codon:yes gene_type:complete
MNIFAVDEEPALAAFALPDKLIVKMPVETSQMIALVFSKWYHNIGPVFKANNEPYKTDKGAYRNHPCTKWAAEHDDNLQWLLQHGISLCNEYESRYGKKHACERTIRIAALVAPEGCPEKHTPFVRSMPDDLKYDNTIDTITAYRIYLNSKPWVRDNYLRVPDNKPYWIGSTSGK